jgi:hypothetical protein
MSQETVEFSAKVPKDLYDRFKVHVPLYGGTQWLINSALSAFVAELDKDPSLSKKVEESVNAMLQLNRTLKENTA